ncbi:MAG: SDR family NAD(P)-dependent oxidoreductase, partial [Clostridia bacterium]|nr:SDR family NAD(P)-dependent oxidoreductase [Clostridia bacterium]
MKLPFQIDLSNKVAVITGAGGVLCSGFAEALAACGAKVALLDINVTAAEKVAQEIRANGGEAIAVEDNCLKSDSLNAAYQTVSEK